MLKKMLLVALCIFCLPMIVPTPNNKNAAGSAFSVVFAGHINPGGRQCTCGCEGGCICDPDEPRQVCSKIAPSPTTPDNTPSSKGKPSSDLDYGTGAMILALALFVWLRLRS